MTSSPHSLPTFRHSSSVIPPIRPKSAKRHKALLMENLLLVLTLLSVFLGTGAGIACRQLHPTQRTIDLIGFPGELFMNLLKALILPLIAASLVSGLSQLDARQSSQIGAFAVLYYTVTLGMAVATGICLVLIIHPGDPRIKVQFVEDVGGQAVNVSAVEKLLDLFRNMFPDNIVQATSQQIETEYREQQQNPSTSNASAAVIVHAVHKHIDGMNTLGMIVFFIAIGLVMGSLGREAKPLADLFIALNKVIMALVDVVMWYAPIGIASLIAAKILEIHDLYSTAQMLALYVLTVLIGLAIHLFLTLPGIHFVATHKNPYMYMRGLIQAAVTAIGTSSTTASLPVTFRCVEENNGVDPKYTKFVLPVGALVNMGGTALYAAVASMFIAQSNGVEMTPGTVLTMAFASTLASLGAAMPSSGLITILIVLSAVGLPASDVTMIIAVDWLLDRARTMTNVLGNGMGCGFVEALVERWNRRRGNGDAEEGRSTDVRSKGPNEY